jgi:hypothetical protein
MDSSATTKGRFSADDSDVPLELQLRRDHAQFRERMLQWLQKQKRDLDEATELMERAHMGSQDAKDDEFGEANKSIQRVVRNMNLFIQSLKDKKETVPEYKETQEINTKEVRESA